MKFLKINFALFSTMVLLNCAGSKIHNNYEIIGRQKHSHLRIASLDKMYKESPDLKGLKLKNFDSVDPGLITALSKFDSLTSLEIDIWNLNEIQRLSKLKNLEKLILHNVPEKQSLNFLKELVNLKEFVLYGEIPLKELESLNSPKLERLTLGYIRINNFQPEQIKAFSILLGSSSLNKDDINDRFENCTLRCFSNLQNLRYLKISSLNYPLNINNLSNLDSLSVSVGNEDELEVILKSLNQLSYLHIESNSFLECPFPSDVKFLDIDFHIDNPFVLPKAELIVTFTKLQYLTQLKKIDIRCNTRIEKYNRIKHLDTGEFKNTIKSILNNLNKSDVIVNYKFH